jgi:predicted porin
MDSPLWHNDLNFSLPPEKVPMAGAKAVYVPIFSVTRRNFMNKKLVAVAVAGAFALPLAAQAQTANVTLYGRLNMDLEFVKGKQADGSDPTVNRVSSNSSRFGMRGTESLGGGLNAIFQIESAINGDTGGNTLAGRETFVGLQGSWGKATIGKFLMPLDDLHPIFGNAPTLTTSILSTAALWAQGPQSKGAGGFDARTGNNIRYDSPNFAGFTTAWQYSTRDSSGVADANAGIAGDNGDHASELRHAYVLGGNLIYASGPWQAGVAFERNQKVRQYAVTGGVFNAKDTDFSATVAYDFGTIMAGFGLRLAGVYERTKYETPTGDLKRNFWGVSGTVPVGGGKVYLFYGRAGDGTGGAADGTTVGGLVKGPDSKSQQWEISYSYSLSPRTLLYAGYVRLNNECNAKYVFNINAYAINTAHSVTSASGTPCNGKPQGAIFGIVHFF